MDRWEQIHRWVEGVDQADQTAAQISSGHLRTCERGWTEHEEEQTDELCEDVAEGEAVAELFAVSGDQKIVQPPLYEGEDIEQNEGCKKRQRRIKRRFQRRECQETPQLCDSHVDAGVYKQCKCKWFNRIFRYQRVRLL